MQFRSAIFLCFALLPAALRADSGQMLTLYFRSDCAPCLQEMNIVPAIAKAHGELAVKIITLNGRKPSVYFPPNVDIIVADEKEKKDFKVLDSNFSLPFSIFTSRDGTLCGKHYGILGTEQVNNWVKTC